MKFKYAFPTLLFFSVVIMSICVALFGSWMAARNLKNKKIALALKNI